MLSAMDKPRLSVFRSGKHIYAQIINDEKGITMVSASDLEILDLKQKRADKKKIELDKKLDKSSVQKKYQKKEIAGLVGELLAKKALKMKITNLVFDRGSYKYHGRVAALADGARKGGLKF